MPAEWAEVAETPALADDEVQLWRIDLVDGASPEEDYRTVLSAEEIARADRLRAGQVRMQFLAGRSFLRVLLGRELRTAARDVCIIAGAYGKPELPTDYGKTLHFNVAHSRSTVLIALGRAGALGVDVEYLDRDTDVMEMARHALTARETDALRALGDDDARRRSFLESWTRKEAIVKADGRGLSLPLTSFEIPVGASCWTYPVTIRSAEGNLDTVYYVSDVVGIEGAVSALAVATESSRVRRFRSSLDVFNPWK